MQPIPFHRLCLRQVTWCVPRLLPARAALLIGLLFLMQSNSLLADHDKPNIVLILADDLGYGGLSCYGQNAYRTLHLDRMASEGVRLTQFNTPASFCAPTRAALLTGRYPFRCGMTSNPAPDGNESSQTLHLPPSEILLPELLKLAGYRTAMLGKWHLGHHEPRWLPTHRGFDSYFGIPYSNDMRPVALFEADQRVEYPVIQANFTKRTTERALAFIEQSRQEPFFLYIAHAMPHKPLAASEAFYKKSGAGLYADVMLELDWSVGQVLQRLKELNLDEKTLVLFTSDNGATFGGSTGGLRGMKGGTYEGGYRVPMLARWPGKISPGRITSQLAVMMDLFATILSVAGVSIPNDRIIDGVNIMPLFTSDAATDRAAIVGHQGAKLACVRDVRWKLHLLPPTPGLSRGVKAPYVDPRGPDGVTILAPYEQATPDELPGVSTGDAPQAMQLFDLENDPSEQHDVAANHPEIVSRLKQLYESIAQDAP